MAIYSRDSCVLYYGFGVLLMILMGLFGEFINALYFNNIIDNNKNGERCDDGSKIDVFYGDENKL